MKTQLTPDETHKILETLCCITYRYLIDCMADTDRSGDAAVDIAWLLRDIDPEAYEKEKQEAITDATNQYPHADVGDLP